MKKVVALVLAVMLALSFAACGEKEVVQTGDITVTWFVPGANQTDIQSVLDEANKIAMEKVGAKLDIQFIDDAAYTQRMNMNFASGSSDFDLCFTGYINPYLDSVRRGAYLEISDYVENSEVIKREIPEYARECAKVDGELYGLPNMQIMTTCTGLFVQKALAEEYGLKTEEIKSLEDIEPFLAWVKEKHPEKYPFRTGGYSGGNRDQIYQENIASETTVRADENGEIKILSRVDRIDETEEMQLLNDWFNKGYIRADVASAGDDSSDFSAGKFAAWRSTYKPGGDVEFNKNNPNNECVMMQISKPFLGYTAGTGCMTAINAASKHPDEAFKIFELMHSDKEFYNLICYGIEGKHYNLDENGKVVYIKDSGYAPKTCWKFGSVFNSLLLPGQPDDLWEQTKAFNDSAIKSPVMGFSFDTTNVRTEVAQLSTVTSKYKQMYTGAEPLSAWYDNFISEVKTAGVEKVKAEVEKQVNEWLKNK